MECLSISVVGTTDGKVAAAVTMYELELKGGASFLPTVVDDYSSCDGEDAIRTVSSLTREDNIRSQRESSPEA